MSLKRVVYTDSDGRKKLVLLPEGALDNEAEQGIPVGPPSLEELNLPIDIEIRLNNELFNREVFTPQDALSKRDSIVGAIQSALKVDANSIVELYVGKDFSNHASEKPATNITNPPVHNRRSRKPR